MLLVECVWLCIRYFQVNIGEKYVCFFYIVFFICQLDKKEVEVLQDIINLVDGRIRGVRSQVRIIMQRKFVLMRNIYSGSLNEREVNFSCKVSIFGSFIIDVEVILNDLEIEGQYRE